jgi:peptidoglycan/LPS O-acetylase OafA/YrhL
VMRYRPEIDGLRALAVIPVILFHAGFQSFSGGFVGVDVFFVISGYLITTIIIAEKYAGNFSLVNFYERRARRILPALFFVMFVSLPFAWMWLFPSDLKSFSQSLVAVSLFGSNILFWHTSGYFDTATELKPLLHTWSLAVEEQYYVLFPIFLMLTWKLGKRWIVSLLVLAAFASLMAAQWGSIYKPWATFYLLPTRGWEILIGAFIAFYPNWRTKVISRSSIRQLGSISGLLLIAFAILEFDRSTPYPSLYTLIPTVGTASIILFATHETLVGKLLGAKLPVFVGQISYSAYLWHQPLIAFARHRTVGEPSKQLLASLAVLALLLAYFSWKFVELPCRNKALVSRREIFASGALCSVCFVAIGMAGYLYGGFPNRFDAQIVNILNPPSTLTSTGTQCLRQGSSYMKLEDSCILGSKSMIVGALIGDSHASALAYELGVALNSHGLGLAEMIFFGCPPIPNVYRVDMDADDKCADFNDKAANYLRNKSDYRILVVVSRWTRFLKPSGFDNLEGGIEHTNDLLDSIENGARQRNPEALRVEKIQRGITSTILGFLDSGKTVILVYPIPEVGWDAPSFLAKESAFVERNEAIVSTSYEEYKNRNRLAIETLDAIGEHKNLIRAYPDKVLCDSYIKGRCIFAMNGESLYVDTNHLSNAGARLVVSEIARQIEAAR